MLLNCTSLKAEVFKVYTYKSAPYTQVDDGKKSGLIVEIVKELFIRAKLDYQIEFVPIKRSIIQTSYDNFSCVLPVARNQKREASFQWISPILITQYGLFSREHGSLPITTLADAKPYRIGSYLGSSISEYLIDQGFNVEVTNIDSQNVKKLIRGRFELWASDVVTAHKLMHEQKVQFGEPELIFFTSISAMACNLQIPKQQIQRLRLALESMYKDGFIDTVYHSYGINR